MLTPYIWAGQIVRAEGVVWTIQVSGENNGAEWNHLMALMAS